MSKFKAAWAALVAYVSSPSSRKAEAAFVSAAVLAVAKAVGLV